MDTTLDAPVTAPTTSSESTSASSSPAPSSAASSPPASPPATSGPPARPGSAKEAFAQIDAQQQETPAGSPGPATTVPADASAKPTAPPQETWPQILANARTKAAAEAEAKFNQEYGWARAIPQQTIQDWSQIARRMSADPIGFLNEYVAELQRHPVHSVALRSEAGRILSGHANGEPPPDVQLVNEQGQVTGMTYSADGLAKREQWLKSQWLNDVNREYGPLKAERDQERQTHAATMARQQLEAKADGVLAELRDILGGAAEGSPLWADVNTAMGEHPDWSAHRAALHVKKTKLDPQSQQTAQAAAADTFRKKAAGQTADGRASTSTPPTKLTSRKDIAEFLRSRDAGG